MIGVSDALAIVDRLVAITKNVRNAEVRNALADLKLALASVKVELSQEREKVVELEANLRVLRSKRSILGKLVYREKAYYLPKPTKQFPTGPFCPACYGDGVVSLMLDRWTKGSHLYACHKCKAEVRGEASKNRPSPSPKSRSGTVVI